MALILHRKTTKLEKELGALENRLSKKGFIDKAPAHVVEKAKLEVQELEDKLAVVRNQLASCQALN